MGIKPTARRATLAWHGLGVWVNTVITQKRVAQSVPSVDGSVRGRGRLFGPVMTSLNPLYNNNFLPREEREKGGGPLVLI